MGMLAATKPQGGGRRWRAVKGGAPATDASTALHRPPPPSPALLFRGCVMDGLFSHVHDATIRTLQVNGYEVREVPPQVCCGALHAHAGLRDEARRLAGTNIAAFGDDDTPIVVNSAGCGAMLKEYGHLVAVRGRGEAFAARVRDVSELLAERGPRPGAPLDVTVAYDPPCHLMHAQGIAGPPERMLGAIPVLRVITLPDAARCCGSAGLFTVVAPAWSRAVRALTGSGAVTFFQGLLTNDVDLPGDGSFVYGALLTPKGMIVVDGWAARLGTTVSYTVPGDAGGRERALAILTRSVPPRLARVSDRTAEVAVYRLAGPGALAVAVADRKSTRLNSSHV